MAECDPGAHCPPIDTGRPPGRRNTSRYEPVRPRTARDVAEQWPRSNRATAGLYRAAIESQWRGTVRRGRSCEQCIIRRRGRPTRSGIGGTSILDVSAEAFSCACEAAAQASRHSPISCLRRRRVGGERGVEECLLGEREVLPGPSRRRRWCCSAVLIRRMWGDASHAGASSGVISGGPHRPHRQSIFASSLDRGRLGSLWPSARVPAREEYGSEDTYGQPVRGAVGGDGGCLWVKRREQVVR